MAMSMAALQKFEKLRVAVERASGRSLAGKVQEAPAPLAETFELFEDFDKRISALEKERDERGIVVVGEPSKSLVDFVDKQIESAWTQGASSDVIASGCIRALMGRVLYEVEKVEKQYSAEARGAAIVAKQRGTSKDDEWLAECKGGEKAAQAIAEALRKLIGKS